MSVWKLTLLLISGMDAADYHATPFLANMEDLRGIPDVSGAGDQRGPRWYDYRTSVESDSDLNTHTYSSSASLQSVSTSPKSSAASSLETKEKRIAQRAYRQCTPCKQDMLKTYKNIAVKWICGKYQRARRSFKSECMMRYRNCQDGTMFVKMADHRCHNDTNHGRHWFYIYKVN